MQNKKIIFSVLFFIFCFSFYFPISNTKLFNSKNNGEQRKLLSIATGRINQQLPLAKVLKIHSGKNIFLEIYLQNENNSFKFLERFDVNDAVADTHLDFKGITSNLILSDVNDDDSVDILVPVVDQKFTPRLRAYSYDSNLKHFVPLRKL